MLLANLFIHIVMHTIVFFAFIHSNPFSGTQKRLQYRLQILTTELHVYLIHKLVLMTLNGQSDVC